MDGPKKPLSEEDPKLQSLFKRLEPCDSVSELAEILTVEELEAAVAGLPDGQSEIFTLCLLNYERIIKGLDYLPEEFDDWEGSRFRTAFRLGAAYLTRIGFLKGHVELPEGVIWKINPKHPTRRTLEILEKENPFLHKLAGKALSTTT